MNAANTGCAFSVFDHVLDDGVVMLEASAGTGKTWSLTALVLRLLLERGLSLDAILLVTFTNKATDELRDRLRQRLDLARRLWAHEADQLPATLAAAVAADGFLGDYHRSRQATRRADLMRLREAAVLVDAAAISTIHGCCARILSEQATLCGLAPGTAVASDELGPRLEACRQAWRSLLPGLDAATSLRLLGDEDDNSSFSFPKIVEEFARWLAANRPRLLVDPEAPTAEQAWLLAQTNEDDLALRNAARRLLFERADAALERLADRARSLGADALTSRVLRALEHPQRGPALAAALRTRWPAVLVDEFQDSDPMQVSLFSQAFGPVLLRCVGDPKQSIYRFRGADLHAYQALAASARRIESMAVNFRSSPACVAAVNHLFAADPRLFLDPAISFSPAQPSRKHSRLHDPESEAALIWWWAEAGNKPEAVATLSAAVAAEIRRLVDHARLDGPAGPRGVRPADCAVLTASNAQATAVGSALRAAGLPAILRAQAPVLASPAAAELELLLAALASPDDRGRARAAWATRCWGRTAAELLADDQALAADGELLRRLERRWRYAGVLGSLATVLRERGSRARLLAEADGERFLTDLLHSAELLHQAEDRPAAALARLRRQRADGGRDQALRLEDDGDAVSVLTVHAAKGLQWPVVFAPFLWASPGRLAMSSSSDKVGDRRPLAYRSGDEPVHDWRQAVPSEAGPLADREQRAEALRHVYVALTRAEERSYVAWGPLGASGYSPAPGSGLALLAGAPLGQRFANAADDPEQLILEAAAASHAQRLATKAMLWVDPREVDIAQQLAAAGQPMTAKALAELCDCSDSTVRSLCKRLVNGGWLVDGPKIGRAGSWQSSGKELPQAPGPEDLVRRLNAADSVMTVRPAPAASQRRAGPPPPTLQAAPITARLRLAARITSFSGLTRGAAESQLGRALGDEGPGWRGGGTPEGMHAFPAGAGPGDVLHRLIEHADLAAADSDERQAAIAAELRRSGLGRDDAERRVHAAAVSAMLVRLGRARVPGCQTTLADLDPVDLVHEWPFDLHLGLDQAPRLHDLAEAWRQHGSGLLASHWPQELSSLEAEGELLGWLSGRADLVTRIDGRWWVLDWKSNRLGPDAHAYAPAQLLADAIGHRYPLQWTIYLVALHRQLAARWPGYDPAEHLGGSAYAYLRGLGGSDGNDPEAGWLVHRPSPALVEAWSQALGGWAAASDGASP